MDFACEAFASVEDFSNAACDCGVLTATDIQDLLEDASDLLAYMSHGKVVGRCTSTVRPCRESGMCCGWWGVFDTEPCCCGLGGAVQLVAPVVSIDLVTIGGTALPSGDYQLVDGYKLLRVDDSWPGCQNLALDSDQPGTFEITYTHGRRASALARLAATELACALSKGVRPAGQQLPPGTTFASHQGVQLGFATRAGAQLDVAINLPFVQQFLALYGPDSGPGRGSVYAEEMYDGWSYHSTQ